MAFPYVKPTCATCPEVQHLPEEELEWFKERNLDLALACRWCTPRFDMTLEDALRLQEKRLGLLVICRDCSEPFLISPDELAWLFSNELKLFKRCPSCREINKAKNQQIVLPSLEGEESLTEETVSDGK